MKQEAEAVYSNGVLKPTTPLQFDEGQLVRVVVETVEAVVVGYRADAFARLIAGIERMDFDSSRRDPAHDETDSHF